MMWSRVAWSGATGRPQMPHSQASRSRIASRLIGSAGAAASRVRRLQHLYGLDLPGPDVRLLAFLETRVLERSTRE